MVLNDWQRGRIPFFVKPPGAEMDEEVNVLNFPQSLDYFSKTIAQALFKNEFQDKSFVKLEHCVLKDLRRHCLHVTSLMHIELLGTNPFLSHCGQQNYLNFASLILADPNALLNIYSLKLTLDLSNQYKAKLMLEMAEMETEKEELENRLEAQDVEGASSSQQEDQKLLRQKQEEMQKIFSNVKQNFGKLNVAPEFSEEDLVPVEMPDILEPLGSEDEQDEENEEDEEKEQSGELQEEESSVSGPPTTAEKKSTREVNKEMDMKIAKLKQFLDRAKSKHFSAIRLVLNSY